MVNSAIANNYFYFIGVCDGVHDGKWLEIDGSKLMYGALLLLVGINNIFKGLKKMIS
jgi:hypothetical protein